MRKSRHLSTRLKERAGIPKRAQDRYIKTIIEKGYTIDKYAKHLTFYKYLTSLVEENYTLRVFDKYILVISDSNIGVTLLQVPKEFLKYTRRKSNGSDQCEAD